MVPLPMTVALDASLVGLTGLLLAGVTYAALHQRTPVADLKPGRLVGAAAAVLVAWAALSMTLAVRGTFAATPRRTVPAIAFGIAVPIIAGVLLLATSVHVRRLGEAIPLPWLIGVQFYRVLGVLFVIAYLQHRMPGQFALPAGLGDVAVGLAAPGVALAVARGARALAWIWNIAGVADLSIAVTLGFLTSPTPFQQLALGMPNVLISRYPFVLIPVFAVPASILLHVFAAWRLREAVPLVKPDRREFSIAGGLPGIKGV